MVNDTEFVAINAIVCYCTGDKNKIDGNERTGHNPPTSPPSNKAPPTTTTATPTPSTKGSDITKEGGSTTQQPAESHSDSKPSSNPNSGNGSSDHTSDNNGDTPPTKQSSVKAGIEVGGVDKSVLNQGKGREGATDCGKHGCDGSGVIAIAVVASICFIIIVLVVAVLLKKVITDNRRRRFKNVDYLINGMYT